MHDGRALDLHMPPHDLLIYNLYLHSVLCDTLARTIIHPCAIYKLRALSPVYNQKSPSLLRTERRICLDC